MILSNEVYHIPGTPKAELYLCSDFMSSDAANAAYSSIINAVHWRQDTVTIWGRTHNLPRLQQWYGDAGATYTWSGLQMQTLEWIPEIQSIRDAVQEACGQSFNSVLVNRYRDGSDMVGWHSDSEAELGGNPIIASVSLGVSRSFRLKRKDKTADLDIRLYNGSLLIMAGETQAYWNHCVPRRKTITGGRANLTFRNIVSTNINK